MKKLALVAMALFGFSLVSVNAQELKRHKITVGYGILPATDWADFGGTIVGGMIGIKKENSSCIGAINAGYAYRLTKVWAVGLDFAYSSGKTEYSGLISGTEKENYYSVMPTVKINWLNGNIFRMYSKAGIGATFASYKFDDEKRSETLFAWQASPVGMEVGKGICSYLEAGLGQSGSVIIGLRYRL